MTPANAFNADLTGLLEAQRRAFLAQEPPDLRERKSNLRRLRTMVLNHRAALAAAVSEDFSHRSRDETDILEVMVVIQGIDYLIRNLRRFMRPERRHVGLLYRAGSAKVLYQPKGVVGIVAPWNYPISLTLIPLATALAAGNRALLKPSEVTPRTSALLQRLVADTFRPDTVSVVVGDADVGAAFCALPFDHLFFTGSTAVGRKVMEAASRNLVPVTLELGGKSPAIVAPGQVTTATMASLVYGKLANAGQTCVAPDYAFVHERDLDAFVTQFEATTAKAYPDGMAGDDYSAIVSPAHFQRLEAWIAEARVSGARIVEAMPPVPSGPETARKLGPVLVIDPAHDTRLAQEEVFGPVLLVRTYRTMDEVVAHIHARPRPLALYYFGPRDTVCETLLRRTHSGNVGINHTLLHVAQDDLPFGGIGASGMGAYHGIEGFRAMSHAKGVFVAGRWSLPNLLRPPYKRMARITLRTLLGARPTKVRS